MRLTSVFEAACAKHAATPAIATPTERITYGELLEAAGRFADALAAHGVAPGDRVGVWLPNGVDWLVAHWGIALAGAILVPVGTRNRAPEARHMLGQSGARALVLIDQFLSSRYVDMLGDVRAGAPGLRTIVVRAAAGAALPPDTLTWDGFLAAAAGGRRVKPADDVHVIQYTSGTTGQPKGAMLAGADLLRVATAHAADWGIAPGEAIFIPGPFSHIMSLALGVLMPVVAGVTCLTLPAFVPAEALRLIARERAVAMAGAASMYVLLADCPELGANDLASVRLAFSGGAPLTARAIERIVGRLGIPALVNGFGLTEASGSVTRTARDAPAATLASSIGRPMPWLEVRVVDPGAGVDAEVGELWIRGPGVMKGYYGMPDATAEVLGPDGWLRTGDLVRARPDGSLELAGRLREMIIVRGFNVFPAEIERALLEHDEVAEACVVATPDETSGELPYAFVRLRPGATLGAEALLARLKVQLASYKVPRAIELRAELPMLPSGKLDRRRLRREAAERAG